MNHHFRNARESRGDTRQGSGHGFHEHGGQDIAAAIRFRDAWQCKNAGKSELGDDVLLGKRAG